MIKLMLKTVFAIIIFIILLLFIGWIVWTFTFCKGTLGNTICSNSYWWMLGLGGN
jgi:hypothetical protein